MTKQQQIDTLQKQLNAANEQIATIDNALKEQYVNIATNIVSEIKCWFGDQHDRAVALSYDDIYKFLDNLRNVIEDTAPKYTASVLCELSMALSETRRIIAEQRIVITRQEKTIKSLKFKLKHIGERICRTKDALNRIYGGRKDDFSPANLYGQAVISEYLKQHREENNNDER